MGFQRETLHWTEFVRSDPISDLVPGSGYRPREETIDIASRPSDFEGDYCGTWSILMAEDRWWWLETYNCKVSPLTRQICNQEDEALIIGTASTIGYTYYILDGSKSDHDKLQAFKGKYHSRWMEWSNIDKHREELSRAVYNTGRRDYAGVTTPEDWPTPTTGMEGLLRSQAAMQGGFIQGGSHFGPFY